MDNRNNGLLSWRAHPAILLVFAVGLFACGDSADSDSADQMDDQAADTVPQLDEQSEDEVDEVSVEESALMDPTSSAMNEMAPESFRARFETTKGDFIVEAHRAWSPNGVDRFYNLVRHGFYDGTRFFRVLDGFVAQFGINGDPLIQARWQNQGILDDPVMEGNLRGRITFAKSGAPNSRTTQLFINYGDANVRLDEMGFSAFGEVIEGMDVVDALYSEYGEGAPGGAGPSQGRIVAEGNAYLDAEFPNLDYIDRATILPR